MALQLINDLRCLLKAAFETHWPLPPHHQIGMYATDERPCGSRRFYQMNLAVQSGVLYIISHKLRFESGGWSAMIVELILEFEFETCSISIEGLDGRNRLVLR